MNERPLSKVAESFSTDLNKHAYDLIQSINRIKELTASEERQKQAFLGGCKDFSSEDDIKRHYAKLKSETRRKGNAALDRLITDLSSELDYFFNLKTQTIQDAQTKLNLGTLSEGDIQRITEGGKDDYSLLSAVAGYAADSKSSYAKAIRAKTRDFETEAAEAVLKIEKFVNKGLAGDRYAMDSWLGWCESRIERVQSSYDDLQAVIRGENNSSSLLDTLSRYGS